MRNFMYRYFWMFIYSCRFRKKVPFVIHSRVKITKRKTASYTALGRLYIGLKKTDAVVSLQPANLYFGWGSVINLGHSISVGPGVNLVVKNNGKLHIGNGTYFTSDSHIEVVNNISIGRDCAISWGVTIIDSDHHVAEVNGRASNPTSEVSIGNHVWIGCNVTVLKGTVIGDNCIVAAGSVVKGKFESNTLIAGNPAKAVKQNISWT